MRKKFIIDIDGTICITLKDEKDMQKNYRKAKPKLEIINKINELYDKGNIIIFYSARHWIDYELTKKWLEKNKVKYHTLILSKPVGHYYVDESHKLLNTEQFLEIK